MNVYLYGDINPCATIEEHRAKMIVVKSCQFCPVRLYSLCRHPETDGWEIENMDTIPEWCPLEDAKGE